MPNELAIHRSNLRQDVTVALPEDSYQFGHSCMSLQITLFKHACSAQRQKTNHRAYLHSNAFAVGHAEKVIVEPIVFIPHFVMAFAHSVHGIGNPDKVLCKT